MCFVEEDTDKTIFTQKGDRLYTQCQVRDRTWLEVDRRSLDMRGVIRAANGIAKRYIAQIGPTVLTAKFSSTALRVAVGI